MSSKGIWLTVLMRSAHFNSLTHFVVTQRSHAWRRWRFKPQMTMRRTNIEYSSKCQAEYCTATFAKRVLVAVFLRIINFK